METMVATASPRVVGRGRSAPVAATPLTATPVAATRTGIVYGYLRESSAESSSPENQQRALVALAQQSDIDPASIRWVSDWGQSGRYARAGMSQITDDIKAGRVRVLLALDADRLWRSAKDALALYDVCDRRGVRILTVRRGELRPGIERGIFAVLALAESDHARERAAGGRISRAHSRAAHRKACALGADGVRREEAGITVCGSTLHWDGYPPYGVREGENLAAVLDAYAHARSYERAARALNDAGVLTATRAAIARGEATTQARRRRRPANWKASSVRRIVRWAAGYRPFHQPDGRNRVQGRPDDAEPVFLTEYRPEAAPVLPAGTMFLLPHGGRHVSQVHALSGLVRCAYDGKPLSVRSQLERTRMGVRLICREGGVVSAHPRPYSIQQEPLMRWLNMAADQVVLTPMAAQAHNVDALRALDRRVADNDARLLAHEISGIEYDTERQAIDRERQALEAGEIAAADGWLMGIDWSGDTRQVNTWLRQRIARIELDLQMRPVAVVWRSSVEGGVPVEGGYRLPYVMPNDGRGVNRLLVATSPAFERVAEHAVDRHWHRNP